VVSNGTLALQRPNPVLWASTPGDYATLSKVHHIPDGTCAVRLVRHGGVNEIVEGSTQYVWHHQKFRTSVDWSLQVLSGAEPKPNEFSTDALQNKVISKMLESAELREAARKAFVTLRSSRNKVNHAWTSGEHTREHFNGASASGFLKELQNAADAVDRLVNLTIAATTAP